MSRILFASFSGPNPDSETGSQYESGKTFSGPNPDSETGSQYESGKN